MRHALLALPVLAAACQPAPVTGPGDPYDPAGYRHLDHAPPAEVIDTLRIMDDAIPTSTLRIRDGCYAAFHDGAVIPVQRGGAQYCLG